MVSTMRVSALSFLLVLLKITVEAAPVRPGANGQLDVSYANMQSSSPASRASTGWSLGQSQAATSLRNYQSLQGQSNTRAKGLNSYGSNSDYGSETDYTNSNVGSPARVGTSASLNNTYGYDDWADEVDNNQEDIIPTGPLPASLQSELGNSASAGATINYPLTDEVVNYNDITFGPNGATSLDDSSNIMNDLEAEGVVNLSGDVIDPEDTILDEFLAMDKDPGLLAEYLVNQPDAANPNLPGTNALFETTKVYPSDIDGNGRPDGYAKQSYITNDKNQVVAIKNEVVGYSTDTPGYMDDVVTTVNPIQNDPLAKDPLDTVNRLTAIDNDDDYSVLDDSTAQSNYNIDDDYSVVDNAAPQYDYNIEDDYSVIDDTTAQNDYNPDEWDVNSSWDTEQSDYVESTPPEALGFSTNTASTARRGYGTSGGNSASTGSSTGRRASTAGNAPNTEYGYEYITK